jgi:hypothetical protein
MMVDNGHDGGFSSSIKLVLSSVAAASPGSTGDRFNRKDIIPIQSGTRFNSDISRRNILKAKNYLILRVT